MFEGNLVLTLREREILGLVRKGLTNKEIAYELKISENTVKHHVKLILSKSNIHDRKKLITSKIITCDDEE